MKTNQRLRNSLKAGIFATALFCSSTLFAQVKIGDNPTSIAVGSALEIESTTKGLRMPQVALTSTIVFAPVAGSGSAATSPGMAVFNSNSAMVSGTASNGQLYTSYGSGEYYWDGFGWVSKNAIVQKTEWLQAEAAAARSTSDVNPPFAENILSYNSPSGSITYTASTVTLKPGRTYKLIYKIGDVSPGPTGQTYTGTSWFDMTSNTNVGSKGWTTCVFNDPSQTTMPGGFCEFIVSPTVTTTYKINYFFPAGSGPLGYYARNNVLVITLP
ncbi:hypothetical protein [Dyadobacter psychrotolerans]|uniref:DUF4198 domain-containing protein n=1 Tax=Dyadobacter psychrotolerans TaxID=2541721 RepID=A0A4R5DK84_9BACT|nr:hypothetical protein [Dyadobacter psychrotolerans]TDE14429.1 hypothetical protein E0F88_14605 [Dyadobacter psychrotolerans]